MTRTHARLKQLLFAWLAVTALILSAACSKKSDDAPAAPPAPAPTATPKVTKPGEISGKEDQKNDKKPAAGKGELDKNSGKSAQDSSTSGEGDSKSPAVGEDEIVMDPTGLTPEQIFDASAKQGQPLPGRDGGTSGSQQLYFSGAGQDFLHEQLQAMVETRGDKDNDLIRRLGMATFEVDWQSRKAKISISLRMVNGKKQTLDFRGSLDNKLTVKAGDLSQKPFVAVEAACMDLQGGCNTVHLRIRKKHGNSEQVAHVIARQTSAYLYTDGNPPGASQNPEYDNLMNVFLNTVYSPGGPGSVQAVSFITSEVIGGASEFAVLMRVGVKDRLNPTTYGQLVGWSGPLVKPKDSFDLNIPVSVAPATFTTQDGFRVKIESEMERTLRETRLVRNDGRGNLQLEVIVRKGSAQASEDTIHLTVARKHVPTRDPILK